MKKLLFFILGLLYLINSQAEIDKKPAIGEPGYMPKWAEKSRSNKSKSPEDIEAFDVLKEMAKEFLEDDELPSKDVDLLDAAHDGKLDDLKSALAKGANINSQESNSGSTALFYAAYNNDSKMVTFLLQQKYINRDLKNNLGLTPLMIAARQGHLDAVNLLLDKELNKSNPAKIAIIDSIKIEDASDYYSDDMTRAKKQAGIKKEDKEDAQRLVRTALEYAVSSDDPNPNNDVITALLKAFDDQKVDTELADIIKSRALALAIAGGKKEEVGILKKSLGQLEKQDKTFIKKVNKEATKAFKQFKGLFNK